MAFAGGWTLPPPFDQLFDQLPCAIAIRDGDGRLVYANELLREFYGLSIESDIMTVQLFDADGVEIPLERAWPRVLLTGEPHHNKLLKLVRPDGTFRWVRGENTPVKDEAGRVTALVGISVDVTEVQVAQDLVRQREAYFRALVENESDVISVLDAAGRVLFTSQSIERIFGLNPILRQGTNAFLIVHPDDIEQSRRDFAEVVRVPGARRAISGRIKHADGSWHWTEGVSHNRLDDPAVGGIVINWRDVTARHEAEQRAQLSSERWQRLVEQSPNAVVTIDADGHVLSWNRGAERIFGWTEEEVLGRECPWVPVEERARRHDALREVWATGRTESYELERLTKEGRRIPVLAAIACLATDSRELRDTVLIITMTDLTVHKQAEEQARSLALLEERDRIAMELHDGVIQSLYALGLNLNGRVIENAGDFQLVAKRARAQIDDVIRDIRNFILDIRPNRLDEHSLQEGLTFLVEELKANTIVRVNLSVGDAVGNRLRPTVVNELLQMAREATSNVMRHSEATVVDLTLEQVDESLVMSIRDNGSGFDLASAELRRGDGITNITARARALGGSSQFITSPGIGTVVRIEVPLVGAREAVSPHEPWRVLIAGGQKGSNATLIEALEHLPGGVTVSQAATYREALKVARQMRPKVMLLEVDLPDGSGIEACRLIRSQQPAIKVLLLAACSADEAALASIMAGASGYVLEHDDPKQLAAQIERVAAGGSLLDQSAIQAAMQLVRRTDERQGDEPSSALNELEGRVLRLVAEGKTNREIARVLALSEHLVRTHTSSVIAKLQLMRSPAAAARLAPPSR